MNFQDIKFYTSGITLRGRFYTSLTKQPATTVCVCHGIPSGKPKDAADGGYPVLAGELCAAGHNVMLFNFRGTGESGGNLDMLGWKEDLMAALDWLWLRLEVDKDKLVLLGSSGGAAIAVQVAAADTRVAGVALWACPADFGSLLAADKAEETLAHYREIDAIRDAEFPASVDEWYANFRGLTPEKFIAAITPRKLLIVHGEADTTVPVEHAHRLFIGAGEPKQLAVLAGVGHQLRREAGAVENVQQWLAGV
ncbi:alpha/beta hydrolase [Chloroflexota bacterium]